MSPTQNYYKILGVEKNASFAEIKKRYRELAKKHHPDVNNGSKKAENNFKIISTAYDTLSNKKKRKEYDQTYGRKTQTRRPSGGGWSGQESDFDFRGRRRTQQQDDFRQTPPEEEQRFDPEFPTRGFDLQFMVDLPLKTVALGGTIPYSYEKHVKCLDCDGTGSDDAGPCPVCKGKRLVVQPAAIDVKIPPGVADRYTLRVDNEGGEGKNGGPPGDLLLQICMEPHPRFKRVRDDIYAEIPISPELAEKGGPLEIETLDSVQTIEVEDGTLTGEEFRIKGQGAAILWGKKRGDFVVKFKITEE
ncbi:MAG: chaperone protein DnaJ [Nitrospinaceae bacterium]|nr:MAG: chaperone protein DnaJ [Nitrospinaceae bacterium]